MSTTSTPITEEINAYLDRVFSLEDDFLRQLNKDAEAQGIPSISIAPEQISFLNMIMKAVDAKHVIEIGSLGGYSAISMARALPSDGKLVACEVSEKHANFITDKVREAHLEHVITVLQGPALETLTEYLQEVPQGSIDAVFIDADKLNYTNYFNLVFPFIKKGGLIIGDNAMAFGKIAMDTPDEEPDNVLALRAFNDLISSHPDLQSTLVPLGDGMVIGLKLK